MGDVTLLHSLDHQLAIGIDEGTALLVRGDRGEVVGVGTVTMFDGAGRGAPTVVVLKTGERYDLAARRRPTR